MNAPHRTEVVPVRERSRLARGGLPRLGERYAVEEEVGRGATGVVYRAVEMASSRSVAVKVHASRDEATLGRVRREAAALARLEHPSIARVIEVFESDGLTCVVSEFVEGEDLTETVKRRRGLPAEEAVRLFVQLLEALDAVHSKGLVHRDVKPANIRIGSTDGRLVLVDFGLVRLEGDATLTGTGEIVGTPAFMAPEQVDDPGDADARSDLYAAAGVLYFMIEGGPPFRGATAFEVWTRHRSAPIPRLTRGSRVERLWLGRLVSRGLAKRPARRWSSARAAIEDALEASSRIASPTPLQRLWAWVHAEVGDRARGVLGRVLPPRTRRPLGLFIAAGAVAAAIGIGLFLWLGRGAARDPTGRGDRAAAPDRPADLAAAPRVARASVREGNLVALDAFGRELWAFDPGAPLRGDKYLDPEPRLFAVTDVTGDGVEEVLFGATHADPFGFPPRLYCFNRTGTLLWQIEAARREVVRPGDFKETAFEASMVVPLATGRYGLKDVVLVSGAHVWSPSQVLWVDSRGTRRGEWWHHGTIGAALAVDLNDDGRDELVVGAYNNTYSDSGLAVLEPSPLSGSSPPGQDGRPVFEGIGPGTEAAYVRFPRNEIARVLDKRTQSEWIREEDARLLRVKAGISECAVFYDLDRGLAVVNAFASDECRVAHKRLEIAGALDHPYAVHGDDLFPAPLYWIPSGWSRTAAWNRPLARPAGPGAGAAKEASPPGEAGS